MTLPENAPHQWGDHPLLPHSPSLLLSRFPFPFADPEHLFFIARRPRSSLQFLLVPRSVWLYLSAVLEENYEVKDKVFHTGDIRADVMEKKRDVLKSASQHYDHRGLSKTLHFSTFWRPALDSIKAEFCIYSMLVKSLILEPSSSATRLSLSLSLSLFRSIIVCFIFNSRTYQTLNRLNLSIYTPFLPNGFVCSILKNSLNTCKHQI